MTLTLSTPSSLSSTNPQPLSPIIMLIRPSAIGLFTWYAYSAATRLAVQRNVYQPMQLLAETNNSNNGNHNANNKLQALAAAMGNIDITTTNKASSTTQQWVPLRSFSKSNKTFEEPASTTTTTASLPDDCLGSIQRGVAYSPSTGTLFGKIGKSITKPTRSSLRQLAATRDTRPRIVENLAKRAAWMHEIDKSVLIDDKGSSILGRILSNNSNNINSNSNKRVYTFLFRDYVTPEEVLIMLSARWCMERLVFRARKCGELAIHLDTSPDEKNNDSNNNKCVLTEWFAVLGVVPLKIVWEGEIRTDKNDNKSTTTTLAATTAAAIHWTTTSMRLGWSRRFLGTTIDKPPLAEKLRQEPWTIALPTKDDNTGDVLVLHRVGIGKLVYAVKECLRQ